MLQINIQDHAARMKNYCNKVTFDLNVFFKKTKNKSENMFV